MDQSTPDYSTTKNYLCEKEDAMKTKSIKALILCCLSASLLIGSCDGILQLGNHIPSGTPLWAKSVVGGTAESWFRDIEIGNDGIYAAGTFTQNELIFQDGIKANGPTIGNFLIAKYDFNGNCLWVNHPIAADYVSEYGAVAIQNNEVFAIGSVANGNYDFGNSVHLSSMPNTGANAVLVKYNINGNAISVKSVTGPSRSYYTDIACSMDGIYTVGVISGTTYDCGDSVAVTGSAKDSAFVVKYNVSGVTQWAKSTLSATYTGFSSVTVDNDGIYAVGWLFGTNTADFGNLVTVTGTSTTYNPLIVKYNSQGVAQWAKSSVNSSEAAKYINVFVNNGNIYVAGEIDGNTPVYLSNSVSVIGPNTTLNCLLVKYDNNGNALWARSATNGLGYSRFYHVSSYDNYVYAVGALSGFATYDFGNKITIDALASQNPILVEYDQNGSAILARSIMPPAPISGYSYFYGIECNSQNIFIVGTVGNDFSYFNNSVFTKGVATENCLILEYKR
jgi:hypothetical protein